MVKATLACTVSAVPEIVTELLELALSAMACGKEPEETLQLKGAVPPVA
jgi:hypothetical protein